MAKTRNKSKKDIMYVDDYTNRFGELSFILHCGGQDPLTRKPKVYVKTYKVPVDLKGKKEIEAYRLQVQLEWKSEVEQKSLGTIVKKERLLFRDFATKWVDNILDRNKEGFNYYRRCKDTLPTLIENFGNYYLHEINQFAVGEFIAWLGKRTYDKEVIAVKSSLMPVIENMGLSLKTTARNAGISHPTLFEALKIGARISSDTVLRLCNYLGVAKDKYFSIAKEKVPYSLSSNQSVKTMLHSVFASAVKLGLMERNFASKEFTERVTGRAKDKKEILDNMDDIKAFIRCIELEQDIRKKVAFSIYINLGLRNAEVAGLTWSAVSFDTNQIAITQNTIYVSDFGTRTKDPKTKGSARVLSVPIGLMELLKKYKEWWDCQKENMGDLWEHTDKLFVQRKGADMAGATLRGWLYDFQDRNGLKRVSPHGLRHSNTTMLITNGADIKTVSARLGHADVQTTLNIYSQYTSEADRKVSSLIDELLSG